LWIREIKKKVFWIKFKNKIVFCDIFFVSTTWSQKCDIVWLTFDNFVSENLVRSIFDVMKNSFNKLTQTVSINEISMWLFLTYFPIDLLNSLNLLDLLDKVWVRFLYFFIRRPTK